MQIIESTSLWRRTLSEHGYVSKKTLPLEKEFASRLRESFKLFRNRVATLTGEIATYYHDLTVHDIKHIDALWQCADTLLGDDYPINPTEAYVLGGAFLLHDAGLALASYQDIQGEIKGSPLWRDCAAVAYRREMGKPIAEADYSNLKPQIEREATEFFLRQRHAERAAELGLIGFRAAESDPARYLIDDSDLRDAFAHVIGQIAYSHWWSAEQVVDRFTNCHGAFAGGPSGWQVDPLKLAFILRTCDATQIDARRAPAFLRSLRKPVGLSDHHWKFQGNMLAPHVEGDAIVFTSKSPFQRDDSEAWWTGKSLLELADRELRDADAYLRDLNRPPLLANRVAGIHVQKQLTQLIQVDGWAPVDTSVHVSNVAKVIEVLGGQGLYGDRPYVPLREMLQNARDAVLARRIKEDRGDDWGRITVELAEVDDRILLRVSDNGVGMSKEVLTGALLDFGASYWKSQQMIYDHPGLASRGFEPTGKYGIGFFSVFMLADDVRVITRRAEDAKTECNVLEFSNGLDGRVILREAIQSEQLLEAGTTIELWLKKPPRERGGLLAPGNIWTLGLFPDMQYQRQIAWSLADLCVWLAPALDVSLEVVEDGASELAITAADWASIPANDLIRRILLYRDDVDEIIAGDACQRIAKNIAPVFTRSGETIGRAAIGIRYELCQGKNRPLYATAVTTAGQFRSSESMDVFGLFVGDAKLASRNSSSARAVLEGMPLANWATNQAKLAGQLTNDWYQLYEIAMLIRLLGGDTLSLPIFRDAEGHKSFDDIAARVDLPSQIDLKQDHWGVAGWSYPELKAAELGVSSSRGKKIHDFRMDSDPRGRSDHPVWNRFWMSLWGAAIEAIAQSWKVPLHDVLEAGIFRQDEKFEKDGREGHRLTADTLIRPS